MGPTLSAVPPHEPADALVDVTGLFSLRENAIAKEPGASYPKLRTDNASWTSEGHVSDTTSPP